MLLTLLALKGLADLEELRDRARPEPTEAQDLARTLFAVQAAFLVLAWPLLVLVFVRKRLPVPAVLTAVSVAWLLLTDPWSLPMVGLCLVFALAVYFLARGNHVGAPFEFAAWCLDRPSAPVTEPDQPTLF